MDIADLARLQRQSLLRITRGMNAAFDRVFYDVDALTPQERNALVDGTVAEGSVIVVYPGAHRRAIEKHTPIEYIRRQTAAGSETVDAVVVAGVGSSDLGTAALARNAADYLQRPVAGIVSGFGLADMITEALGGWFVLGNMNRIRDGFAKLFDLMELRDHVWDETSYRSLVRDSELSGFDMNRFVYGSPDSAALLLLLYHLRDRIRLLVGHSKGNYVIENALQGLVSLFESKSLEIPHELKIVTLGAVVRFPRQITNVSQFLGSMDGFGLMNSRLLPDSHVFPGAWHTLNTRLPGHMAVAEALGLAGVQ